MVRAPILRRCTFGDIDLVRPVNLPHHLQSLTLIAASLPLSSTSLAHLPLAQIGCLAFRGSFHIDAHHPDNGNVIDAAASNLMSRSSNVHDLADCELNVSISQWSIVVPLIAALNMSVRILVDTSYDTESDYFEFGPADVAAAKLVQVRGNNTTRALMYKYISHSFIVSIHVRRRGYSALLSPFTNGLNCFSLTCTWH